MLSERLRGEVWKWLNPSKEGEKAELNVPILEFDHNKHSLTVYFRHSPPAGYVQWLKNTRCRAVFLDPSTWESGYELPDYAGIVIRKEDNGSETIVSSFTVYADKIPGPLDEWDQRPLVNFYPSISHALEPLLYDKRKPDDERHLSQQAIVGLRMTFDPNFQFLHTPVPRISTPHRGFFTIAKSLFTRAA